jgi:hypothetical protein
MRVATLGAVLAGLIVASTPLLAQTPSGVQASPYGSFFGTPARKVAPPPIRFAATPSVASSTERTKSTVVCGLTLIPADPKIDAGIRRSTPQSNIAFSTRRIEPTICR